MKSGQIKVNDYSNALPSRYKATVYTKKGEIIEVNETQGFYDYDHVMTYLAEQYQDQLEKNSDSVTKIVIEIKEPHEM